MLSESLDFSGLPLLKQLSFNGENGVQVGARNLLCLKSESFYLSEFVKFQMLRFFIVFQLLHERDFRLQLLLKKLLLLCTGVFQLRVRSATYSCQRRKVVLAGFRLCLLLLPHVGNFNLDPFFVSLIKLFQIFYQLSLPLDGRDLLCLSVLIQLLLELFHVGRILSQPSFVFGKESVEPLQNEQETPSVAGTGAAFRSPQLCHCSSFQFHRVVSFAELAAFELLSFVI